MVAGVGAENVAEQDNRALRAEKGNPETAAFACIVACDMRRRKALPAIRRPGERQGSTRIRGPGSARRRGVALIEPGGKEISPGIKRERLEALAGAVLGYRARDSEARPAIRRATDHDAPVIAVVLKDGVGDDDAAVAVDDDLGARIRPVVDAFRLAVDSRDLLEGMAEIAGPAGHDPAAGGPGQP